jgi:hypothetical protein
LDDTGLLHFVVQIVTLTSTLSDTSEHRVTTVGLGNVVNQLLDEHGLSDTGTTEETNLTTTGVGGKQVDDLDTSNEDFGRGGLLSKRRGLGVDRSALGGLDRATLVDGVTGDVHDTTEGLGTDGDRDGGTSVVGRSTTGETLGTVHSNCADNILSQVLSNLEHKLLAVVLGLKSVENGGKRLGIELDYSSLSATRTDKAIEMHERVFFGGVGRRKKIFPSIADDPILVPSRPRKKGL